MNEIQEAKAKEAGIQPNLLIGASVTYSGPIPPAFELQKYEAIQPGLANRIVSMAEDQLAHKHAEERKIVDSKIKDLEEKNKVNNKGQNYAFLLSITAIFLGFVSAVKGYQLFGGFIGTLGIGSIIVAFLYSNKK